MPGHDNDDKNPWGTGKGSKGRKGDNPWGQGSDKDGGRGRNHGHRGGRHGGGPDNPDLEDMLRRAQDNFKDVMPGNFGGFPVIGIVLIAVVGLWLASGFYIVNPGDNAVIQRFGAWDRTQSDEGLGYRLPWPIESVEVVNVAQIRRMNIGFYEGYVRGRSGAQKQDLPEESLMLTYDRNIVDLDLVIQWNIKSAEEYVFEIRDQENTIKKVAESAIREVVGQTRMFPIITRERSSVAERARSIIQENLDEYKSGVNITQVLIEKAEVHPEVQNAFQDVQSAKQDAEDVQNRAEAYREDILPKARGMAIQMIQESQAYKEATVAKANGDAERFNKVYEAYVGGKDVTKQRLYLETMERVLSNATKIILDQDGGQGVVPYLPLEQLKKNSSN